MKRHKHGLTKNDKAMIVCDKAPCHLHQAFRVLRKNWAFMENRIIFGYDVNAEIEVAAGIGGCGAPNDAFHPFVHYARRYLEREQMGHTEVLAMRTSFYEAGCNPTGCTERKLTYRTAYQKMVDEEGDANGWHLKFASRDCYSNTALPENWRHPRTTTMLSWRDGVGWHRDGVLHGAHFAYVGWPDLRIFRAI